MSKVAKVIASKINNSQSLQRVIKACNRNPSLFAAATTLVLSTTLRPLAILATPNKKENKEDKFYGMASSIATGVIDTLGALALFIPAQKLLESASKKLYEGATFLGKNPEALRTFKSASNRFIKIATLPIFTILRFTAVPPIKKKIKEIVEKGKKVDVCA